MIKLKLENLMYIDLVFFQKVRYFINNIVPLGLHKKNLTSYYLFTYLWLHKQAQFTIKFRDYYTWNLLLYMLLEILNMFNPTKITFLSCIRYE